MDRTTLRVPWRPGLAALGLGLCLSLASTGCRTTSKDLQHWATTAAGPDKLMAVVSHDKYAVPLRAEAALALVTMKPRGGRRVGIEHMLDALEATPPAERARVVAELLPVLVTEMGKPPPAPVPGQLVPDPTVPYKDAAFALVSQRGGKLLSDPSQEKQLREGITRWVSTSFPERSEDVSQAYSIEQTLRLLGAEGVRALPAFIVPGARRLDRLVALVAELGEPAVKNEASQRLVAIARHVESEAWTKESSAALEAANKASGHNVTPEQFKKQLDQYQEEELLRLYGQLKRLGGAAAVSYLLGVAQGNGSEKRRAAALAVLEGKLDKNDPAQVAGILAVAGHADTPDMVRDQALRRVGELPREAVAAKLYELFKAPKWKIRWVAASVLLKLSDSRHLDEFFEKLGRAEGVALAEVVEYGNLIAQMKPGEGARPVREVVDAWRARGPGAARATALAYYMAVGTAADAAALTAARTDGTAVPKCKADAEGCEWKCTVGSGASRAVKDIATVADFVNHCVQPAIESRTASATKPKP